MNDMKRLFFALWPDEETRERIFAISRSLPEKCGRLLPKNNLHITLVFLGNMDMDTAQAVQQAASETHFTGFTLVMDRIGKWPAAGVIWLAPSVIPEELATLVLQLNQVASNCGFDIDSRPYQPHATLARKARGIVALPEFEAFDWKIKGFSLVHSTTLPEGARYEVIQDWSCKK